MFTSLATIWKKNQTWSTIYFFSFVSYSFLFVFSFANKINCLITVLLFWIELFYICLFLLEYNIIIFFFSQKIVERNYAYYTVTMYFRNGDDAPFNSDATFAIAANSCRHIGIAIMMAHGRHLLVIFWTYSG